MKQLEELESKLIRAKMREASKLRLRARALSEKAHQATVEATEICSHPSHKVIKWYNLNYEQSYCGYFQCTQCGLRERGSYSVLFSNPSGTDYYKIGGGKLVPDEAAATYTREATRQELDHAFKNRKRP